MYKKVVPISKTNHKNLKLKRIDNFKFAAGSYIASLMLPEFQRAALTYPIVFLEDANGFSAYALLGLKQDENLFVDENGKWKTRYIPAVVTRYPFVLGQGQTSQNVMVCIDEDCDFLSEEEGMPLFDENGEPTKVVEDAKNFLTEMHSMNLMTRQFCEEMRNLGVLDPLEIRFKGKDGNERNITGCYGINEKKLAEVSDDQFLSLRKRGALPAIYAQMMSIPQIDRIIDMFREKHADV